MWMPQSQLALRTDASTRFVAYHIKNQMQKITFILTLLLTALAVQAQSNRPDRQVDLDSLYAVWDDKKQADASRAEAYKHFIEKGFLYSKPDTAFILADALLAFGKKKNNLKAQSYGFRIKGKSYFLRGDYSKASDYYTQSLAISEQLGDQRGIALVLKNIGIIYKEQGDYPRALDYYTQSLAISEQLGDQQGIAGALQNIGIIYKVQGDYTKALDYYTQSLAIAKQSGFDGMARLLANIGNVYNIQSDYPKALDYYTQSLAISEQLRDQLAITIVLQNIGTFYYYQGDYPKALDYYTQSLEISEQLGNQKGIANMLGNIGLIYWEQGDYPKTLDYFSQCLEINKQLGDQKGIARVLGNIGLIYQEQGDYPQTLDYFTQSLEIFQQLRDQRGIAAMLVNIGEIYSEQGDDPKALNYYAQSLEINEQLGDQRGIAAVLLNMGEIHSEQSHYRKALNYCQKSYELALSVNLLEGQKEACQCLYDTYKAMGNGNKALVYMEKMRVVEDSLHSEETAKELQQMEFAKQMLQDSLAQVEADRLVQEAHQEEVRKKNRTRNMLAGGGLILFLLAGGLYSRMRYIRKSKATLQVEKDRSENLLLNILPAEIAEELKEKGKAAARDFEMVSILFTDFQGFTAASAKLSAHDLVSEINSCFEAFDGIMGKYNIEKIKTIGDAYMAAGGLPIPSDDSIKKTVLAALEMQAFISNRKVELDALGKPAFEMRVGVHTGSVVAGIVGVKKFQYDIWGDSVNTASRMESKGEVGKVNISEATYDFLKDDSDFVFESRGKVEAKGKGEIEMYFVTNK